MRVGGGGGAGGSTAKPLKSNTAGRIAVTSNANNVHIMLAKSKPGTAIVTPMAMLAKCGTGSKQLQDVNQGVWDEASGSGAKWHIKNGSLQKTQPQ